METALWRVVMDAQGEGVEGEALRTFETPGEALHWCVKECPAGDYVVNGGSDGRRPIAFRLTAERSVLARTPDDFDALLSQMPAGRSTRWLHTASYHSSFSLN
jgi:hypothetical protein